MGFLWEDSTGARAVKFFREQEQGFEIDTHALAAALHVKVGALYQLLANAVKLRFIKKVHGPGQSIRWKLGAAGDSVTIERRRTAASLTPEELARRRVANAFRRQRTEAKRALARPSICFPGPVDSSALPPWLGGSVMALKRSRRAPRAAQPGRRPATYLARWHVLYRDERGQVHADMQVQAVHADVGVIEAWCEARGGVDRFKVSGFARVADACSGARVDLQIWLEGMAPSRSVDYRELTGQTSTRRIAAVD